MTTRHVMVGEPIDLWLDALASDLVAPASEVFAALAGAAGAALVGAVARRTLKRLGTQPGGARMLEIQDEADVGRGSFLQLADTNAEAYASFLGILRTRADPDDARTARLVRLRDALEATIDGQLQIARRSVYLLGLAEEVTRLGDANTAADGLSAAASLQAATLAALADIEINAFAIGETERRTELVQTCASLRKRAGDLVAAVDDARVSTQTR